MKKWLILFILISSCLYADFIDVNNFSGGLYNNFTPSCIPDNCSPDLQNVYIDRDNSIVKRNGYIKYNTVPISNSAINYLFDYNNGIDYMIAITSHNVLYSQDGTFNQITSGLLPVNWSALTWLNTFIANSITKSFSWDGTNYTDLTSVIPQSEISILYGDRMWVASASGNKSILYYSALFDYNSWNTIDDFEYIGKDDGDVITGMWVQYGNLMISKKNSLWKFVGSDPTTTTGLQKQLITSEFGCIDRGSIKEFGSGKYIFMSNKGLCVTDGNIVELVSLNIQPTINNMTQINSTKDYWLTTYNEDWGIGNIINFDSMTIDGSILVSSSILKNETISTNLQTPGVNSDFDYNLHDSFAKLDNNNTLHVSANSINKFYYYTYSITDSSWVYKLNTSTWSLTCMAIDSLNKAHFLYKDIDSNGIYSLGYSSYTSATNIFTTTFIPTGLSSVADLNSIKFVLDSNANPIVLLDFGSTIYVSTKASNNTWTLNTVTTSAYHYAYENTDISVDTNNIINIAYCFDHGNTTYSVFFSTYHQVFKIFNSTEVYYLGNITSDNFARVIKIRNYKNRTHVFFYTSEPFMQSPNYWVGYSSAIYNGLFDTKGFVADNTGVVKGTLSLNKQTDRPFIFFNTTGATYRYYDGSNWQSDSINSTMTWISPYADFYNNRFYVVYFYVPNYSENTVKLLLYNDFQKYCYISPLKYTGSEWYKWNIFYSTGFNFDNTINYRIFVSTYNNINPNWENINNNTIISQSTGQYIQYQIDLRNINNYSSTTISDVYIDWYNNKEFKPMSCEVLDNRYWLSYGTSNINTNILVMTPDYKFTNFVGINANSMLMYKNNLYTGPAINNGYIYKQDTGWNDDGQSIDAYYWTKAFNLGNLIDEKSFNNIYVLGTSTSSILSCSYNIDESTTPVNFTIPLSSSPLSGLVVIKKGMPYNSKGRYLKVKIGNNQLDKEFNVKGIRCEFIPETPR